MSSFQNSQILFFTFLLVWILTVGPITVNCTRFPRDIEELEETISPTTDLTETTTLPSENDVTNQNGTEIPPSSTAADGPARVTSTSSIDFLEESLKVHNSLRKLHGVPELVLNNTLNEISQAYANKLAGAVNDEPDHSPDLDTYELGENLYYSSSTKIGRSPNATKSINSWYNEIHDYDFQTGEGLSDKQYLHFTQVVWKETTQLGIAYAETAVRNNKGRYVTHIVANYYPRGNQDDFTENVFPLLSNEKKDEPKKLIGNGEETKKSNGRSRHRSCSCKKSKSRCRNRNRSRNRKCRIPKSKD